MARRSIPPKATGPGQFPLAGNRSHVDKGFGTSPAGRSVPGRCRYGPPAEAKKLPSAQVSPLNSTLSCRYTWSCEALRIGDLGNFAALLRLDLAGANHAFPLLH